MRMHVVSDVHAETEALRTAAAGSDVFACLGDLLLYLDYEDPSAGAFAEIFGSETAGKYVALRTAKRFEAARELTSRRWSEISGGRDNAARVELMLAIVDRQYREVFAAMPSCALLTPGNVDVPAFWPRFATPEQQILDGSTVDVDGIRIGMVGGGLRSVYRTPNEVDPVIFDEKVASLGPVDVLLSHIPPAVPELTFDVVARRHEVGSEALRDYIVAHQPRYALFGHVHQPLARRTRIGRTECINVGHFRATGRPFVLDV